MTKQLLKLALTTLLSLTLIPIAAADDNGRILMYVRDGSRDLDLMLREEVGVMRHLLEASGYRVDVATAGDATLAGSEHTLQPTVRLADVKMADYAGIILPCMAPVPGTPAAAEALALLDETIAAGLPIAASRGSVGAVALAGGLDGKTYSYAGEVDLAKRPEFAGAEYLGTGVTRDGTLATAGICPLAARSLGEPDGTAALTRAFIASLEAAG